MTACAYRSLEPVLVQRIADLRERRERDTVLVDVARNVAARRVGRALGGAAGVAFGGAAFLVAVAGFLADGAAQHSAWLASTTLLLVAWPVAIAVGLGARWVAHFALRSGMRVPVTGDPAVDLAVLEARDPLRDTCDTAMLWERRSAALPLAALSLLAPLTIHWLVWCVISLSNLGVQTAQEFGAWIGVSGLLVGHAHIALLVVAVRWTGKLRSKATCALRTDLSRGWGLALGVAVGVACLPGIILIAVPPILVAVTGLLFVPAMFFATARRIQSERFALEAT